MIEAEWTNKDSLDLQPACNQLATTEGNLISRQDAIRWVKTECNPYGKPTLDFESGKKVIEHLEQIPSVDAVEVVRCKDCKHYNAGFECLIEGYGIERDKEWFCGDAERRAE